MRSKRRQARSSAESDRGPTSPDPGKPTPRRYSTIAPVQACLFDDEIPPSQCWGEQWAARNDYCMVAGVDEAGRGPLAGPVVAAAVSLPSGHGIEGIADSKLIGPARREELFALIRKRAAFAVCRVESDRIDEINILRATMEAMAGAIRKLAKTLGREPDCILIDGPHKPGIHLLGARLNCVPIVKGDGLSENIGAASIVAKVARDRLMKRLDKKFRGYGFARHKGYGTPEHLAAIAHLGPCEIHRRTFAGVVGRRAEQESR